MYTVHVHSKCTCTCTAKEIPKLLTVQDHYPLFLQKDAISKGAIFTSIKYTCTLLIEDNTYRNELNTLLIITCTYTCTCALYCTC